MSAVEALPGAAGFLIAGALDVDPSGVEDRRAFAMAIQADGSALWQKTYGGSSRDRFAAASRTHDGGFVLAGATENSGNEDVWVVRVDDRGRVAWQKRYGRGPAEAAHDIVATDDDGDGEADDGFIVAGYRNGPATHGLGAEARRQR